MAEQALMKEGLNAAAITHLAQVLQRAWPAFPAEDFIRLCCQPLEQLELKQRIRHVIQVLQQTLPAEFEGAVPVLEAFARHWQPADSTSPLRGFPVWPVIDYVAEAGLHQPELALPLLKTLTPLFSAEFAIRPFILAHPELSYRFLHQWLEDDNPHVRRLVSEGTRPRLPWGQQLKPLISEPTPNLPLLNALVDDDSDYVRRSVANHLNDIAKDHPLWVVDCCRRWQSEADSGNRQRRDWVIRHATRTLVKQGLPEVFQLLGYEAEPALAVELSSVTEQLTLGDTLAFNLTLTPQKAGAQKLVVDYVIHHVKANGALSPKVFKLKNLVLTQPLELSKQHAIRAITTRRYYSGQHLLQILVNGRVMAEQSFRLHLPETERTAD